MLLVTHDRQAIAAADHVICAESDHRVLEGSMEEMIRLSDFCRQLTAKGGQAE